MAAAEYLAVSAPTVREWMQRGLLERVPGRKPVEVEIESLRALGRFLTELRESGQDRDWLRSLVDRLHDRAAVRDDALQRGLDDRSAGRVQPA